MGCGLEEKSSMISGRLEGVCLSALVCSVLQMGRWANGQAAAGDACSLGGGGVTEIIRLSTCGPAQIASLPYQ
jgi:hypothetical protein